MPENNRVNQVNPKNQIKYSLLKRYFGHDSFRSGQEELVDHILGGCDVLGIMPTGAGKSICYQLPAMMLEGITIVISPLISLMKDQVNSLIQAGLSCAYLNSSLTAAQYETAINRARTGAYKIIYVAPERLDTQTFRAFARQVKISMIAVDEAHCVSQWGQDFRPSYLKIREFADSLEERPIIAAFTATATDAVKRDIEKMLELKNPFSVTTGFDRKNLYFAVSEPRDKLAETERLIRESGEASGIVYCSTRKNTELVCGYLNEKGIACTRYHAGLSDEERRKNQDDFIYDRVRVMAATNAFGMGIDKSNVSFVIHFNMPKNLESYYQEAGRAGRDGSEAVCTLLFSRKDVQTCRFLIQNSNDNSDIDAATLEKLRERDYRRLDVMVKYCTTTDCLRQYILEYFGERSGDMCAKCSNCAASFETEDVTLPAQKILSCVYRLAQRNLKMSAATVADILRGSKNKRVTTFNLSELSTYGIMTDVPNLKIRAIIEGLCDRGYMRKGEYSSLILTNKAREILFDGGTVSMAFKKSVSSGAPKAAAKSAGGRIEENPELFERLRKLRTELAEQAKVPAYIIFSDATLHDICRKLPKNDVEFLYVSGVGSKKAERYGEVFTQEVKRWLSENPNVGESGELALSRRKKSQSAESFESKGGGSRRKKPMAERKLLSEIAAETAADRGLDERLVEHAIQAYLTLGGYLEQRGGELCVTPKGGVNGISMSTKCGNGGERTTVIEYRRAAQKLIDDALDEILS